MIYAKMIKYSFLLFLLNTVAHGSDPRFSCEAWRTSSQMADNFIVSYSINRTPTPTTISRITPTIAEEKYREQVVHMYSQAQGLLKLTKKGAQIRFDQIEESAAINLDYKASQSSPFCAFKKTDEHTEIHGNNVFYYYSPMHHSGCIRSEWQYKPSTPISRISTPDLSVLDTKILDSNKNIVEIRNKESSYAIKYYLDSQNGMMPQKIEYYQVLPDGNLFLYQFFVVEKYKQTDNGSYIPEECTLYDYAHSDGNSTTWEVEEKYKLNQLEVDTDIQNSEFVFKFPAGTRVDDYIANVSYRVLETGVEPSGTTEQTYFEELQKPAQKDVPTTKSSDANGLDTTNGNPPTAGSAKPLFPKAAIVSKKQPYRKATLLWIIGVAVVVAVVFGFCKKRKR
jgi:hypothetical protein